MQGRILPMGILLGRPAALFSPDCKQRELSHISLPAVHASFEESRHWSQGGTEGAPTCKLKQLSRISLTVSHPLDREPPQRMAQELSAQCCDSGSLARRDATRWQTQPTQMGVREK